QLWNSTFRYQQNDPLDMALTEESNRRHLSSDSASRNSSYNHINQIDEGGEQKRRSAIKRYGTYELSWPSSSAENLNTNDDIVDSAQVARKSLMSSKHSSLTSSKHSSIQDTHRTSSLTPEDVPSNIDSSFIIKNVIPARSSINVENRHSNQDQLNISSDIKVEYERKRSPPSPPPPIISQIPPPVPQPQDKNHVSFNFKNDSSQKFPIIQDQFLQKQKNRISIESSFIDPRLLAKKNHHLVKTQSINRKLVKRGQSFRRNKIPPRNMEFAPTSNPIFSNDPTDMDADLPPLKSYDFPWLPGPSKPPQLLHASLVPLPNRSQRTIASSNINRTSYISSNKPGRVSNLLSSVNVKRNSLNFTANQSRLTRANSSRKRASIMVPQARRASLIFRQQILEESLMMSFGQSCPTNSQPTTTTKPLIRKKTKKEEPLEISSENNLINHQVDVKNRPIENSDLLSDKENIIDTQSSPISPRSPLTTTNNIKGDFSSLFSSLPDKRYPKTDENLNLIMSSVDQSPFPAHLSQSKFEQKSNGETSRKLQSQRSPPPGGLFNNQPSGSQLNQSGISNISPPIPISPPISLSSLSPQSTKQQFMSYPRPPSPPINSPPQSPPLSPSRVIRLVKTRRANDTTSTIQDPEKLRKMEQFEALIASTEAQNNKKSKTGKIRALTTAIIPATSSSTPDKESNTRSSCTSLTNSVAESVHYRPEEKDSLGKPGPTDEDGVIRVTLTPKGIYYKDVEENGYNLLIRPYNFPLPKNKEKDYFLLKEIAYIFRGPFGSDLKKEEYVISGS
ncbi:27750_t:CDS:2, partial [Racocetra persica]